LVIIYYFLNLFRKIVYCNFPLRKNTTYVLKI